ncbi:MAG: hypothetical protein DYG92_11060 [Leptolyngbya sp. PLA1]|nr:hypothetical protein [Leptolyngbya sp. PLA1]
MNSVMDFLNALPNLLLVILGFGAVVFIHELGHFLAARWAGIRVLAFAIGFGPAIVSFRKGWGVRLGSSENDYTNTQLAAASAAGERREQARARLARSSPTEYRINLLPLGGYVKMLGQVDGDPSQVSDARDSYQNCRPVKRMVVISAGVVANIISAALLFILIYTVGKPEMPPVIGSVGGGSPASVAEVRTEDGTSLLGGLLPGDRVLSIDGEKPKKFDEIGLTVAMAKKGRPVSLTIERSGAGILVATVVPEVDRVSGLLNIGVGVPLSGTLVEGANADQNQRIRAAFAALGLESLDPGMTLTSLDGLPASTGLDLTRLVASGNGEPVIATFQGAAGTRNVTIRPRAVLQSDWLPRGGSSVIPVTHLLGLAPVMKVADATNAEDKGLRTGDIFALLGSAEYPSPAQGIVEIQSRKGSTIRVVVLRKDDHGVLREVDLGQVAVNRKGQIGFGAADTADDLAVLSMPATSLRPARGGNTEDFIPAAASLVRVPGTTIVSIAGEPVHNFTEIREALKRATTTARDTSSASRSGADSSRTVEVPVLLRVPVRGVPDADAPDQEAIWTLSADDVRTIHGLGWEDTLTASGVFQPEEFVLKADGIIDAVRLGVEDTHRVMLNVYMTFVRLSEGTVKIEHLKGPVGIAHVGTLFAERGIMSLLFFLALISVNLAVVNFLPIPFVDGGQFLFLIYEQIRGRPPSIAFQNIATMAGLALIVSVFLVVTFNDIRSLFGL